MQRSQALQVTTLPDNGYFVDPLGPVRILDHYHSFLFYVNTTDLENGYQHLFNNAFYLRMNSTSDKFTHKLFLQLTSNIQQIREILDKLNYKRSKRGLVNVLGKAIKFIAGNPDNDDLKLINDNFNEIYKTRDSEIKKINQLASIANHLTSRLAEDTKVINENIKNTKFHIQIIKSTEEMRTLIINEIYHAEKLLNNLLMIERTITFSLNNIPSLELLKISELMAIRKYLLKIYDSQQLLQFDNTHLFKILESAKVFVIGTDQAITFLLKIPILNPYQASYSKIYPIPNKRDVIVIPPKTFIIEINNETFWTNEDCHLINSINLCTESPSQENCTIPFSNNCQTAKITNNYKIVRVLRNQQLLALFKNHQEIIEDCHGLIRKSFIKGSNVLSSNCKLIIDSSVYDKTVPTFQILLQSNPEDNLTYHHEAELHLRHLTFPSDLLEESKELENNQLHLPSIVQLIHYGMTGTLTLACVIFIILGITCRSRIIDLFCKPRKIIRVRRQQTPPDGSNEDVPS